MVNNQVKVRIPQVLKSFTDGKLEVSIDADRISTLIDSFMMKKVK